MPAIYMTSGGVTLRSFNENGNDCFIWGFRSGLTLKDGFLYTSNAVGTLYDIDRVEVIKGPAAMEYGQAAYVGGIINFVSRQPTDTLQAGYSASIGSFGYREAEAHVSGPAAKRLLYRLDAGATGTDSGPRRWSFYRDEFAGINVVYDFGGSAKLSVGACYTLYDYDYSKTVMDPNSGGRLFADRKWTFDEPWENYGVTVARASAMLVADIFENLQTRTFVGCNNTEDNWVDVYVTGFEPGNIYMNREAEDFVASSRQVTLQEDLAYDLKIGRFASRLTLGVDQIATVYHSSDPAYFLAPISLYSPAYHASAGRLRRTRRRAYAKDSSRQTGAYVEDQLGLFDRRLDLLGGLRYAEYVDSSGLEGGGPAPIATATHDDDFTVVSRYSALVHPTRNTTLYAAHLESFIFNSGTTVVWSSAGSFGRQRRRVWLQGGVPRRHDSGDGGAVRHRPVQRADSLPARAGGSPPRISRGQADRRTDQSGMGRRRHSQPQDRPRRG